MNSDKGDEDYCGIFASDPSSDERSVAIAVRTHKTLELVDDKFYMITCGKAGFQNTRYIFTIYIFIPFKREFSVGNTRRTNDVPISYLK